MKIGYLVLSAIMLMMSGCVTKQPSCTIPGGCEQGQTRSISAVEENGDDNLKIPAFPYKPIIGTRNNDAKTIVDTGVVMKVYIATYKDSKKSLVAAHDRYIWAKEPGFIVGTERPDVRKRTGMMTANGSVPFVFGEGEIDGSSIENNTKIRTYLNNVAESEKRETSAMEAMGDSSKYDSVIKNYLEKTKGK